jgi:hypothetical protein
MAKNGISTLATKALRQIAKLDLAQTKRQLVGTAGYRELRYYDANLLPARYQENDTVFTPHPDGLVAGRPWKTTPNILGGLWRTTYTGYFGGDSTWFDTQTPTETIQVDNFNLYDGDVFSSQWVGYFKAPETLEYRFYLHSDDASKFWIGDTAISGYTDANTIVKIDAYTAPETGSGFIPLTAGEYYPIRLQYGNIGGTGSLDFSWSSETGISDSRLKRNIDLLETRNGIKIYSFQYLWSNAYFVGVMAQDLLGTEHESAVVERNGYYTVDYGQLGFDMQLLSEYLTFTSIR